MAFAIPLAIGATLAGGAIAAYGKYQAGQAASKADAAQADVEAKLSTAEAQAANVTEYAGYRASEYTGQRVGAGVSRQATEFASANVGGPVTGQIRGSQLALGRQEERETVAKYQDTAQQERLSAAAKAAGASRYQVASVQDVTAGDIGAAAAAVSTVGQAASVSSKWYSA